MRVSVALLLAMAAAALVLADHDKEAHQHAAGQDLTATGASDADDYVIKRASTVVHEGFNLSHRDRQGYVPSYATFMSDLDFHVNATGARWIQRHPVLGRQNLRDPPPTLFNITVTANPGGDTVSFLLRSDNLYLAGFSNKQGRLFSFKGELYTLPGSKPLSFGSGYPDFFPRNGHHGLLKLLVNRETAVKHLRTLSRYQATTPDEDLKFPLAFFILIICEAERFAPLRKAVMARWEGIARNIDEVLDHRTNTLLLDLVVNWRVFSCALLSWSNNGETPSAWRRSPRAGEIARFGVTTAQGALSTINPILQPASCN